MPRGQSEVPELRLDVLDGYVTTFLADPNLALLKLFGSKNSPSSSIRWESKIGGRGMAPFVPPGSPAPRTSPLGIAEHRAEAAFWKEKMYMDEEFLNNIRKEGTVQEHKSATEKLAEELGQLVNRSNRRKEWMYAKMLTVGSFSYLNRTSVKINVDYGIPSSHIVTLGENFKWENGVQRRPMKDIIDGKRLIANDCGGKVNLAMCNSKVLEYLALDPDFQTLLAKTAFGAGNLFDGNVNEIVGANPKVIGALLDLDNLMIYDERYEVRAWLTGVVTATSTTTISVDDVTDFEVGGKLRFNDVSENTWEEETIASIEVEDGTVTVSTAPSTSYKTGVDYVSMIRPYIPDDKFIMMATSVEGNPIAQYFDAPFDLDRHYGIKTDSHEEWDPSGIFIRVQNKGLPVLMQRDAIYILDVN